MTAGTILITGASSGIGQALAEILAAPGVTLGLVARRMERLRALGPKLEARGARVLPFQADVRDAQAMTEVVNGFAEQAGGIGLAIANAGISFSGGVAGGDPAPSSDVIAVNVQGVLHTLVPAIPHMIAAGGGHIVAVGSVAGFRGLAGRSPYNASKAAVKTLMDGFRPELKRHGIHVTTICPGFIVSEMTDRNQFPMPFLLQTEPAARKIERAIRRRRKTYIFPWQWRLLIPLMVWLPDALFPDWQ